MIVLDTNIISELMKPVPNANVEKWLTNQTASALFTTAITEAELRYAVAALPQGRRRRLLAAAIDAMLAEDFADRILPFDSAAAVSYAEIAAARRASGHPSSQFDAQIAAMAKSRGAALATRNTTDFQGCGIRVIDPWDPTRQK